MRRLIQISSIVVISLLIGSITFAQRQSSQGEAPLTNAAVVKLAKAGFKEKTIISIIAARVPRFDLSADRMIELKKNGVSEKVIVAMLARQEGMDFDDDAWGDDPFYSSKTTDPKLDPGSSKTQDNGVNIFGNSGGSKSQTKSRGGNGDSSGDTVTTGSATVRILRPPTEAGGSGTPARLEKAKTLTNDSIVELVEAGFSEGTIIRRIEQSPVDFDLAPAKVEDLRKRRVGDKILSAMKAAMGDESAK